jgi:hypothetical protein
VANGYRRPIGAVLGRVLAHEVGHLVLPVYSHSKTGIMCGTLNPRAEDGFTAEQVATLHAELPETTPAAVLAQ